MQSILMAIVGIAALFILGFDCFKNLLFRGRPEAMKGVDVEHEIREAVEIAHRLIHELHQRDPKNVTFKQCGLLDGRDIVLDYVGQDEWELAFDHLLYMIHEADIAFDIQRVVRLHEIAECCGVRNGYTRDNLTKQGVLGEVFNVPNNG